MNYITVQFQLSMYPHMGFGFIKILYHKAFCTQPINSYKKIVIPFEMRLKHEREWLGSECTGALDPLRCYHMYKNGIKLDTWQHLNGSNIVYWTQTFPNMKNNVIWTIIWMLWGQMGQPYTVNDTLFSISVSFSL